MSDPGPRPTRSGCLSEEEVLRVRDAPPGRAPEELALHLAGCERCQARVLFGPERRPRSRRERARMPTPGRALALVALMAAVLLALFFTLRALVGGP